MVTTRNRTVLLGLLAMLAAAGMVATAVASGGMRTDKLGRNLCEVSGGAKIVPIPGFPGERIDRRLLTDVRMLVKRYKIFITDGFSNDPVHSANGEHPMGLALDIVPNKAAGGSWKQITALAKRAEPTQNQPVAPFRWVGYDGDSGHGRGHHLHLSWNHSETRPGGRARTVYTMRCPGSKAPSPTKKDGKKEGGKKGPSGGLEAGTSGTPGGIGARAGGLNVDPSAPVAEAGGVDG